MDITLCLDMALLGNLVIIRTFLSSNLYLKHGKFSLYKWKTCTFSLMPGPWTVGASLTPSPVNMNISFR